MSLRVGYAAIVVLGLGGCSSMNDVLKAKSNGDGTTIEYPVSREQAYDICKTVFRWEDCDAIEEHQLQGYMLTSWSSGDGGGSVAGAFVEPGSQNSTKVTVITMRRRSLSLTTSLTESTFHTMYDRAVKIIQSGQPLPLTKPKAAKAK